MGHLPLGSMITSSTERRAHPRAPHRAPAIVTTGRGDVQAEVFDVSVGGLGIRMPPSVRRGEFIRVRLQLTTERGPTWFDPDAVVSRVEGGSVGVTLVSPPASLARALAAQVSAHVHRPSTQPAARAPAPAPARAPAPSVSRRELADLFRSALESVADDGKKKKKKKRF